MQESHKRFTEKYFETLNASLSAEEAGFSKETARQQGWQLLQREDVQEYLQELRTKAEQQHSISKERWLAELEQTGFSNIQDYIEEDNSVKDLSAIDRKKASAVNSVKKTVIDGDFGIKTTTEFKLNDKLSALEKIGRHFGYFEKDNNQKKPETSTTPVVNVYNTTPPLASSEEDV